MRKFCLSLQILWDINEALSTKQVFEPFTYGQSRFILPIVDQVVKELRDLLSGSFYFNLITFFLFIGMLVSFKNIYQVFWVPMDDFERYQTLGCFHGGQENAVIDNFAEILRKEYASFWFIWALLVTKILEVFASSRFYYIYKTSPRFASLRSNS